MKKRTFWIVLALVALVLVYGGVANAAAIREKIAIYAKYDCYIVNEADLEFYSDDLGTLTGEIEGSAGSLDFDGTGDFATSVTTAGTLQVGGNVTSSTGAFTVTDNVMIDGAADALQLTVQGYTTQTADLFVVEASDGTDYVTTDVTSTTFAQPVVMTSTLGVTGQSTLTGGATAAASITMSDGDLTVADTLGIDQQTVITVTNGAAFTPTGTYQQIASAEEVTPTIAMGDANDVLMLVNTTDTTINIADSGTTMLSAAWAGGQYDTLVLLCDGTNWIELARTDN